MSAKEITKKALFTGCLCAAGAEILHGMSYAFTKQSTNAAGVFFILGWRFLIAAAVMTLFLYHGFELWLIPTGSAVAALGDYFTVEFLTKILGFVSGAGFAFISSFMIYKAADALNQERLKFVFAVIFAACMIRQIIFLVQVLMARNVLSGEMWMDLMAPIINNSSLLIFVIFAAILVLPITLFSQPRPARLPEYNPAEYRKILAQTIHKRR